MAEKLATLSFTDGTPSIDFPVLSGSVGPDVIDIRPLYAKTGKFTYDPGFMSTASCRSTITYIDGDQGILMYRGYPIEQLAENCDFLEVAYLIMYGELPNPTQKDEFVRTVTNHTMVHEQLARFYQGFRRDAHPMATRSTSTIRAIAKSPRSASSRNCRRSRPCATSTTWASRSCIRRTSCPTPKTSCR